jgi:hypothetical protein
MSEEKKTEKQCGPGRDANPKADVGHVYQYTRSGLNLCSNCGVASPNRFAESMSGVQHVFERQRGRLVA